jgi:hypothetical protein
MNVAEAKALRRRMREAKEKLDSEFNAAYEALTAVIRPHAVHETSQVCIRRTEVGGTYSVAELALITAMGAAGALGRALEVAKDEVLRDSLEQSA